MIAVELPKDIEARLERLARKTGRSEADCVREALLEYLDDLEDLYLAETRLEDVRAGRSKTIPLMDVIKRHGMEG
jgi:RHH-type transcriptional regulator, rel operon repressor / antitoxin RelB